MSAPGTGDTNKLKDDSGYKSTPPPVQPAQDIIPPWLLVGIFAVIMALTFWILKDNWLTDMTRYRSARAQQNHEYEKAIVLLNRLKEAGSGQDDVSASQNPTYESELGHCYLELKQYDKALEHYKLAQQFRANLPPDDSGNARPAVDFNHVIGYLSYKLGDLDAAEKALSEALKFNKLEPLANFTMGEIAMQRGEFTKAADYFKTVSANPTFETRVRDYYAEIEKKLFAGIS